MRELVDHAFQLKLNPKMLENDDKLVTYLIEMKSLTKIGKKEKESLTSNVKKLVVFFSLTHIVLFWFCLFVAKVNAQLLFMDIYKCFTWFNVVSQG